MRQFRYLLVALLLATLCACAEVKVSGKTVWETFTDRQVAQLVDAVSHGRFAEADKAIAAGANVNWVTSEGLTPLLWVMGTTHNSERIEYLLKAGSDPNYIDTKRLASPMYLASGGNRPDILKLLLRYKGDPNLWGPHGNSMLMTAADQSRDENFEILLAYGADINLANRSRSTVADTFMVYGRFDKVFRLFELGFNPDVQDFTKTVDMIGVPPNSEQAVWKEKVIELLKSRGAKFPAFILKKEAEG
jgi:uncharacterized protein